MRRSDCLQVLLDLLVGVAPPVLEQAVAVCRQKLVRAVLLGEQLSTRGYINNVMQKCMQVSNHI